MVYRISNEITELLIAMDKQEQSLNDHLDILQAGIKPENEQDTNHSEEGDLPPVVDNNTSNQNSEGANEAQEEERTEVSPDVISKDNSPKNIFRKKKKKHLIKWGVLAVFLLGAGTAGWVYKDTIVDAYDEYIFSTTYYSEPTGSPELQPEFMTKEQVMSILRRFNADISAKLDSESNNPELMSFLEDKDRIKRIFKRQDEEIGALAKQVRALTLQIGSTSTSQFDESKYISSLDALQSDISELRTKNKVELDRLSTGLGKTTKLTNHLKDNWWDVHVRMKKVERKVGLRKPAPTKLVQTKRQVGLTKKLKVVNKPTVPKLAKAKKVRLNYPHRWKLKIASNAFTQIVNVDSNQILRLSPGVDVPGCGHVINIDVVARKVMTERCVILPNVAT